jgi:hypothetical protein
MEQINSPVREQAEHVSPVQILAFVLGIVSLLVSLVTGVVALWNFVRSVIEQQLSIGFPALPFIVGGVCGLAAIVLGIIGLVLDRKKQQRTSGLVFSVLGLWFGVSGLVFIVCAAFWIGGLTTLFRLLAF